MSPLWLIPTFAVAIVLGIWWRPILFNGMMVVAFIALSPVLLWRWVRELLEEERHSAHD